MALEHIKRVFLENKLVAAVFVLASAAFVWIGAGLLLDFIYFNDPRHRDEALKGWMTPRYVVMSYDLPRPLVLNTLGIVPDGSGPKRLKDVAQSQDISLDQLTEKVRSAAKVYRENEQ